MTKTIEETGQFGRFAPLLNQSSVAREIYDTVLFGMEGCVVAPTLGSIIPNWLLIVPTREAVNFAQWTESTGKSPHTLVEILASRLHIELERIIWFEHGSSGTGSVTGCGVDHAHIHALVDAPFAFETFEEAAQAGFGGWEARSTSTAYEGLSDDRSYMIAGAGDRAITKTNVEHLGSQYFRRVVANLVHKPHAWNYRTHAHIGNVKRTVETLTAQIGH